MADNRNGNAKAANGKASGAPSTYSISVDTFSKRLKMLYSHWSDYNNELWGSSEVIAIGTPPPSEDLRSRSIFCVARKRHPYLKL